MNILVPIKQVPDTGLNLQIKEGQIDESTLKWVLSPYDEFALEEAVKLKSQLSGKLFVISVGPERTKSSLLTALALGADEAYHLLVEHMPQDPLSLVDILHSEVSKIPDIGLVFCGKLSSDSNNFAVPQMLAEKMNIPFVTNVNKARYEEGAFTLHRECGGGVEEILQAKIPLLLSADKGLNEPSYPSLPGIMKAKKKPIHTVPVSEEKERVKLVQLSPPPEKQAPVMIEGTAEEQVTKLLQILKEKEKLL